MDFETDKQAEEFRAETREFLRRHLPFWLWVPGRRFSRLLVCPACERRTWLAVSWRS